MKRLKEVVKEVEVTNKIRCTCDLDNWQPDDTGHTQVCQIYKEAVRVYREVVQSK